MLDTGVDGVVLRKGLYVKESRVISRVIVISVIPHLFLRLLLHDDNSSSDTVATTIAVTRTNQVILM